MMTIRIGRRALKWLCHCLATRTLVCFQNGITIPRHMKKSAGRNSTSNQGQRGYLLSLVDMIRSVEFLGIIDEDEVEEDGKTRSLMGSLEVNQRKYQQKKNIVLPKDFKDALKTFGSNIIFSNGHLDPWSGGSVLENVSETIVALTTEKGAHHIDLHAATADDPDWLLDQRATEIKLIEGWLVDYYQEERMQFLTCEGRRC